MKKHERYDAYRETPKNRKKTVYKFKEVVDDIPSPPKVSAKPVSSFKPNKKITVDCFPPHTPLPTQQSLN